MIKPERDRRPHYQPGTDLGRHGAISIDHDRGDQCEPEDAVRALMLLSLVGATLMLFQCTLR